MAERTFEEIAEVPEGSQFYERSATMEDMESRFNNLSSQTATESCQEHPFGYKEFIVAAVTYFWATYSTQKRIACVFVLSRSLPDKAHQAHQQTQQECSTQTVVLA